MLRLLVVLPSYEPAGGPGGGVARCISTLCGAMSRLGAAVTVYTTNASGTDRPLDVPVGRAVDIDGVAVYYFPSTFGPRSLFDSRLLLHKLQETAGQFDAVYIAAWFMWLGIAAAKICRKKGVPMIAGIHGGFTSVSRRKSSLKKHLFWRLFLQRAIRQAAAVHLTCHAEQASSSDWLCERPSLIIPNPVDPDEFYPCPDAKMSFRREHGIPKGTPVLLFVGRFDWMKRVDLLMEAVARSPVWYLVLVGDHQGGLGPKLTKRAKTLGIENRVRWAGYLTGQKLREALSSADLLALVSETENFGNVVVEAMLCGLPVLISKEVGVHEYIENQPFVVTSDLSKAAVTEALSKAEQRLPAFRADRERIRQCAIDRFAPPRVADSFAEDLRRLLECCPHAKPSGGLEGAARRLERVHS